MGISKSFWVPPTIYIFENLSDLSIYSEVLGQTVLEAYAVFTFDDSWLWFMYTYCMIIKKRSIFMGGIFDNIIAAMFIHMCTYNLHQWSVVSKKVSSFFDVVIFWSICKTLDTMTKINVSTSINSTSQVIKLFFILVKLNYCS